jgi:hypothetical protein
MRNLVTAYFAVVLAAGVLLGTGLISNWGEWYSDHLVYRWQTESLLDGCFALSTDPRQLGWDLVWANGSVQQVWGLGVPFWRLPFEALARAAGQAAFPDRIAFGIAFALAAWAVLRLYLGKGDTTKPVAKNAGIARAFCAVVLLILFPPFITMCRFRFAVYEEAAAYSYLTGIGLFAGTVFFCRRPTPFGYGVLGFLAGVAGFVRPTLMAYGAASIFIAWIHTQRAGWGRGRSSLGIVYFCFGGGLLLMSNAARFGSGFEFGHRLNLNSIDVMRYATRFDQPFRSEPISSAAVELGSSLFLVGDRFNGFHWYGSSLFPGQSSTVRWREFYFTTYDPGYALILAAVWGGAVWRLMSSLRRSLWAAWGTSFSELDVMRWWSIIATAGFCAFYLRSPFLASRYLLDFGPAFAVGLLAFCCSVTDVARRRMPESTGPVWIVVAFVISWWSWQVSSGTSAFSAGRALSREEAVARVPQRRPGASSLSEYPQSYGSGMQGPSDQLPYNAAGWTMEDGRVRAAVTLFVPAFRRLEVEVSPIKEARITGQDYKRIRAKVGLEFLELEAMEPVGEGQRLSFAGPKRRIYHNGLQTVFLGFVKPEELSTSDSNFRLLRVGWEPREVSEEPERRIETD